MSFIPSPIKSIQYVLATFNGSATTISVTLSPTVVKANSIIVPMGFLCNSNGGVYTAAGLVRWQWISGSQINALAGAAPLNGNYARAMVVEFFPQFVKNQGDGATTVASGTDSITVTISAITIAKTMLVMTGQTFDSSPAVFGGNLGDDTEQIIQADLTFNNSTTIQAVWTRNHNLVNHLSNRTVGYNYLEFK